MKSRFSLTIIVLFFLFIISFSYSAFGQMTPYEQGTVTTIEGKIKSIYTSKNKLTSEYGLHLVLENSSGEYIVHVCPQWVADQQQFQFLKGELLTVSGSVFVREQQNNIYAAVINRRFSSLSKDQQIKIAFESMSTEDIKSIAEKYSVDTAEVERIKTRVKEYLNSALFPDDILLRNLDTGEGLWGGRFYHENMPQIRQKRQEEMKKKMRKRKPGLSKD